MPVRTAFVLLHLDPGGYERVVLNLLDRLDRRRFTPSLVLLHGHGKLCDLMPTDVEVVRMAVRTRYAVPALARVLRRLRPDILFSGPTPANFAALAAAPLVRRGLPVIANEHTPPGLYLDEVDQPRLYRWVMRRLYPRAAAIGVPILDVGTELREVLDLPELKIVELLNPLFDDGLEGLASAEPALPLPPDPVFVAAGRLVAAKGFDVLLDAFSRLPPVPSRPPHLVLLGDGPEKPALERQAAELGVADRVSLPGSVANPFPFFRRAHALVVSSRREATPNVLIEAMACGTPVIATDCWSGPRAVLEDGRAGLLVPPGDAAALGAAMARLLAEPETAAALATRGLERAQAYRMERTIPRFEELIERLALR